MTAPLPAFATKEQYEAMTGQTAPDNIDEVLMGVSTAIRRYCGWHIAPVVTEDLVLDGSGGVDQPLPSLRVVSVQSLSQDGSDVPTDTLEWSAAGILRRPGHWTCKFRGLRLNLTHGWDLAEVGDLTLLTLTMTGRVITSPNGETQASVGAVSVSYGSEPGSSNGAPYVTEGQRSTLNAYLVPYRS